MAHRLKDLMAIREYARRSGHLLFGVIIGGEAGGRCASMERGLSYVGTGSVGRRHDS